ncbi:Bestrophin, RFP-TM, chloride channel-domain-containing protein, partial [Vararia minispora EC-137]
PMATSQPYTAGFPPPDPFNRGSSFWPTFIHAVLATAVFRCWHLLLFFSGWATAVSIISNNVHSLAIQPTLLTVLGTVLGFVISYRTTSSFERYNEGRRYWSQIILASRTFARLVWFHVPDNMALGLQGISEEEKAARILVEKKTVINLLEAFAVAVKHYLRGEEGIYYVDLYHLVKFLPAYALPAGLPSAIDLHDPGSGSSIPPHSPLPRTSAATTGLRKSASIVSFASRQPPDVSRRDVRNNKNTKDLRLDTIAATPGNGSLENLPLPVTADEKGPATAEPRHSVGAKSSLNGPVEEYLLPARNPPKYSYFDFFPFSLLVRSLTKRGRELSGKKAQRLRAKLLTSSVTHNLPHEISLYLSSYVAALQARKALDPPTATNLLQTLTQLVDALTGLERILTTPIPFSYSVHLWSVTLVYCLALPFQLWSALKWVTIPGTAVASFIFFGFLVAGEEIENPFGYDKNDLNMDHFTHNIIREELRAITAVPAPDPANWAFSPLNDAIFDGAQGVPEEWVARGKPRMMRVLASASGR